MADKSEPTTSPPVTSSVEGSHAKTSPSPERGRASTAPGRASGPSSLVSLASYDPATSLWRTSQCSVFGGLVEFSGTWPRAGMMLSGTAYPLKPSAPLTAEIASLSSGRWPTPTAGDAKSSGSRNTENSKANAGTSLTDAVRGDGGKGRTWPTPVAAMHDMGTMELQRYSGQARASGSDHAQYDPAHGGMLNAAWIELLMGFPLGWTDLGTETGSEE